MNKKQFHILLTNYTALTREEAESLILLENEFPYSQVIHGLAARATQDNQLPEKEDQLHLGAIYMTDRTVFKSFMTTPQEKRKESWVADLPEDKNYTHLSSDEIVQSADEKEQHRLESIPENVVNTATSLSDFSLPGQLDESFYEEVQHDLERLKELKHEFEETVKMLENGVSDQLPIGNKEKPSDSSDELLTEIKTSKKKIKPESVKQKEQIEIIDQFIKTQPNIKGKVPGEDRKIPSDDLSEKSLVYNEHIISETLAEILIKQGKKEKAIEVLKKLIWKFPQKKAYFAAQIEELKK